jgi:hypothetical protein
MIYLKSIIIAGCGRNGKTSLARRINAELGHFVINLDKLMTVFDRAYPQLDIRIAWDRDRATANVAAFLGHFLGLFSSGDGMAGDLNLRAHNVEGNRFVLEGGHFDFEEITQILRIYGARDLRERFILIGLVQNEKTAEEYFQSLREHDTEDDWTHGFSDAELREFSEMSVNWNREMTDYLTKFGFTIYDVSTDRDRVFDRIITDVKAEAEEVR